MAKGANKQYIMSMAERFGLRVERNRRGQALKILSSDGQVIYNESRPGAPEVAWEDLWRDAARHVKAHTGVRIFHSDEW